MNEKEEVATGKGGGRENQKLNQTSGAVGVTWTSSQLDVLKVNLAFNTSAAQEWGRVNRSCVTVANVMFFHLPL